MSDRGKASHHRYALVCLQTVPVRGYGPIEDIRISGKEFRSGEGEEVGRIGETKGKASHHGYARVCLQAVPAFAYGSDEDIDSSIEEFGSGEGRKRVGCGR